MDSSVVEQVAVINLSRRDAGEDKIGQAPKSEGSQPVGVIPTSPRTSSLSSLPEVSSLAAMMKKMSKRNDEHPLVDANVFSPPAHLQDAAVSLKDETPLPAPPPSRDRKKRQLRPRDTVAELIAGAAEVMETLASEESDNDSVDSPLTAACRNWENQGEVAQRVITLDSISSARSAQSVKSGSTASEASHPPTFTRRLTLEEAQVQNRRTQDYFAEAERVNQLRGAMSERASNRVSLFKRASAVMMAGDAFVAAGAKAQEKRSTVDSGNHPDADPAANDGMPASARTSVEQKSVGKVQNLVRRIRGTVGGEAPLPRIPTV